MKFLAPLPSSGHPDLAAPVPAAPGSSAPVAIVLALALAATVGVSARSWSYDMTRAAGPQDLAAGCAGNASK
jgi:hypothetical protein